MGFEGNDLDILAQRAVGVQLLTALVPPDVDVDTVPESPHPAAPVLRLVAHRVEPEPDFQVRARVYAVRVQVNRAGYDTRSGPEKSARLRREHVRITPDLVDGPTR